MFFVTLINERPCGIAPLLPLPLDHRLDLCIPRVPGLDDLHYPTELCLVPSPGEVEPSGEIVVVAHGVPASSLIRPSADRAPCCVASVRIIRQILGGNRNAGFPPTVVRSNCVSSVRTL